MKNFFQFIQESSRAVQQAQRMGLKTDGHGGWYKNKEFVAKTEKGKLEFYNKRQNPGKRDPKQTEKEKNISNPNFVDPSLTNQSAPVETTAKMDSTPNSEGQELPIPTNFVPVEKTKGILNVVFGRFNPPTIAHQELMGTAAQIAIEEGGDYIIVPSRSFDPKKNPLDPDTKIFFMRRLFPEHSERIVNDPNQITIFDTLKKAHNDGYSGIRIICGNTRAKEFENLSNTYNGQLYQFDVIEVFPVGEIDADDKEVNGITSSRMRLAAAEGDFVNFRSLVPSTIPRKEIIQLFDLVRQGMGIEEIQQEGYNLWEIAPKFDLQSLRENYISGNIFKVDGIVENLNTGLSGKIIRRGTNYLICVTEDGMMFKTWIKDVSEVYQEKEVDSKERLPGKPNTLVGTVGYLKYVSQQTPGSELGKQNLAFSQKSSGLDFINKYKKSK